MRHIYDDTNYKQNNSTIRIYFSQQLFTLHTIKSKINRMEPYAILFSGKVQAFHGNKDIVKGVTVIN